MKSAQQNKPRTNGAEFGSDAFTAEPAEWKLRPHNDLAAVSQVIGLSRRRLMLN